MMLTIMLVFTFLCVLFLFIGLFQMFSKDDNLLQSRMEQFAAQQKESQTQEFRTQESFEDRTLPERNKENEKKKSELLQNIGKLITPSAMRDRIQEQLSMADVPLKAVEFVAVSFILTLVFMSLGFFIFKSLFVGFIMAGFGFFLPNLWLKMKHGAKLKKFSSQLLDTLIMMSNGLKAGYSFPQAMEMVAREGNPPSSTEFQRTLRESALGLPMEEALINLNNRIGSPDLDLAITVVLIQRQIGGNLAEILDNISNVLRDRMKLKGQIQTLTAQGRLSGYLIAAMPFGLGVVLYLINPAYMMELFNFQMGAFKGWYLLVFGVCLQAFGFFAIMKITDIDI
ncbi:MAG: secretion system protein [Candidatus Wallbacteria bacterium HGW-Wallbacteria-1]|jgi:tight adherence protein B|uniref:Secretion system protein n=1 Tax=Candidatus Wallbacteria bacterium HGW-Wallbacteria-1 TaxID=2013854 RepID=A0A2N1PPX1_9BACT|nr:MAG: secretion system protein [Candidatus Wallbacteria bacterium HGW-Wallbacteria-1]